MPRNLYFGNRKYLAKFMFYENTFGARVKGKDWMKESRRN